jgi:hypothetical protein
MTRGSDARSPSKWSMETGHFSLCQSWAIEKLAIIPSWEHAEGYTLMFELAFKLDSRLNDRIVHINLTN